MLQLVLSGLSGCVSAQRSCLLSVLDRSFMFLHISFEGIGANVICPGDIGHCDGLLRDPCLVKGE